MRTVLVLFAACIVIPAVVAIGGMVAWNVAEMRRSQEAELLAVARSTSAAVDLRMTRFVHASAAIATSDSVASGNWSATRRRIARLALPSGSWVAITDRAGRRLLNTGPIRAEAEIQGLPRPASIQAALASDVGVVTDLFVGASVGRKVVAADHAVPDSPEEVVVSVIVEPAELLLAVPVGSLPPDGFVTILDRTDTVIARSRDHQRWQGVPATPRMKRAIKGGPEGVTPSRSLDGNPTTVAWTRSPQTGWTTLVVVPRSEFLKPVWTNGLAFGLIATGLLLLGLGLSRGFGNVLIGELRALEEDAARLGHGEVITARDHALTNIGQVQAALSAASHELDKRASRQALMINELNHRVKNTLATVQAIAVQTFRQPGPDASAKFDQRLAALAGAHDLLTRSSWEAVDFRSVVERSSEAAGGHLTAFGPHLLLPPTAALALSLCLHELVTNSLKYGALSAAEGRIYVSWSLTSKQEIDFHWREEGGPTTSAPAHKGFGTRLIDRLVQTELGGEICREFAPAGLTVRARFSPPGSARWRNAFD